MKKLSLWHRIQGLLRLVIGLSAVPGAIRATSAEEIKKPVAPIYSLGNAVTIDGTVSDWEYAPSEGLQRLAFPIAMAEYGTVAQFWARYDADALYVAFRVQDSSPALNQKTGPDRWQGDQVELLLCTDPEHHASHKVFSPYDYQFFIGPEGEEGRVNVLVNINPDKSDYIVPGSQAALKRHEDGKGYDLEAKIPWAPVNRPAYFQPKPGVEIGWQIQVDFSAAGGEGHAYAVKWHPYGRHFTDPSSWGMAKMLGPGGYLFAEQPQGEQERKPVGKATVAFTVPTAGTVSVNVARDDGVLIRRLVIGQKMEKGPHTVEWDGWDEAGKPVAPGTYRFAGHVANLGTKYLASIGNTSPEPYGGCRKSVGGEYRQGCWPDTIMNPDGSFYTLNSGGEAPPNIQLIDPKQGFRSVWGGGTAPVGWDWQQAGARDERYLYLIHGVWTKSEGKLCFGERLSRMDAITHKSIPFANGDLTVSLKTPTIVVGAAQYSPLLQEIREVRGLGAFNGNVFVPMFSTNRVDVYGGEKGEKITSITHPDLDGPSDVWITPDGNMFVVDRHSVHLFNMDGHYLRTPVRGLTQGWSIAVDGNNRMYVSDRGAHQVKVFDRKGELIHTLGKAAGIVKGPIYTVWAAGSLLAYEEGFMGKVDDESFFKPEGITVDPQGNLVVVDPGNMRVQCFDPKFQLRKSLVSQVYSCLAFDPAKPDIVFLMCSGALAREYRMNWETGAHELVAQYTPVPDAPMGTGFVKYRGDQPYFFTSACQPVWTIENGRVRMCSNMGRGARVQIVEDGKISTKDVSKLPDWKDNPPQSWEWRDTNRDGMPQLNEYAFYTKAEDRAYWNLPYPEQYFVDDDWSIQSKPWDVLYGQPDGRFIRIPLKGFDKAGNPIYSWKNAEVMFEGPKVDAAWLGDISGGHPVNPRMGGIQVTKDGWAFLIVADRPTISPTDCRFRAYKDGKRLFSIGRTTKGFWDKPGEEITNCTQMPRPIGNLVFLTDVTGGVHVFTRDGLYAGTLLENQDSPPEAKGLDPRYQPQGEIWWTHVFQHPKNKRIYLVSEPNGNNMVLTYEVTGLESTQSFSGVCQLAPVAGDRPTDEKVTPNKPTL